MSAIEFRGVSEFFGDFRVLTDVNLAVEEIVEVGPPEHFFHDPQNERTKRFNQILE